MEKVSVDCSFPKSDHERPGGECGRGREHRKGRFSEDLSRTHVGSRRAQRAGALTGTCVPQLRDLFFLLAVEILFQIKILT